MTNTMDFKSSALNILENYNTYINNIPQTMESKQKLEKLIEFCFIIKNLSHYYSFVYMENLSGELESSLAECAANCTNNNTKNIDIFNYAFSQLIKLLKDINEKTDPKILQSPIPKIMNNLNKIRNTGEAQIPAKKNTEKVYQNDYEIIIRPSESVYKTGLDLVTILEELGKLGKITIVPNVEKVPDLDAIDPENCYIGWDIRLMTNSDLNAVKDILIFLEYDEGGTLSVKNLNNTDNVQDNQPDLDSEPEGIEIEKKEASKSNLLNMKSKSLSDIQGNQKDESLSTIRVAASRLDKIVDLVGEMVTVQSKMARISTEITSGELSSASEELGRLTDELREQSMSLRMLPVSVLFRRFNRLVHDLSQDLKKNIELSFEGEETELDKSVLEKLQDPLMHLIRNSIDHGIEDPETRIKSGKKESGKIILSAYQSGQEVFIQIQDDGTGINIEKVKSKGIEMGLIKDTDKINDKQILNLVFTPGFSTAKNISNVSGRGVGMDVVKSNIELLRGSVDITTFPGTGTTITLKIPLTLAIIDGFMIKISDGLFVLPLSVVEECLDFNEDIVDKNNSRKIINLRGEAVPYINLAEFLKMENKSDPVKKMVVIRNENEGKIGLAVNSIVGQHQTVIKPLSKLYKDSKEISGATILGDGSVALILDPARVIKTALEESGK